jgi:hypothetical protein
MEAAIFPPPEKHQILHRFLNGTITQAIAALQRAYSQRKLVNRNLQGDWPPMMELF